MVGVVSGHGMVVAGAVDAPMLCLLGEGRSIVPSPSEATWDSSMESSVMARNRDDGSLWIERMMVTTKPSPMKEAQAAKVVGDELEAPEETSFTEGENITRQAFTIHSDGERR
jgi:hypothetical protein